MALGLSKPWHHATKMFARVIQVENTIGWLREECCSWIRQHPWLGVAGTAVFGRQKAELLSSKRSPGLCLYFIQAPKPISVCASVASGIQPSVFTQVKPTAIKMSVSQWNWYSPLCSLSGECFSYYAENSSLWIAYRELNKTICVPELLVSFFSCPFFFQGSCFSCASLRDKRHPHGKLRASAVAQRRLNADLRFGFGVG